MTRPRQPKIRPVDPDTCQPDIAEMLRAGGVTTGGADNVSATLANNPGLFRRFMPFAGKLLGAGKLSARDRELAILRTAWLCGSDYEWRHHVRIAREEGLADDVIEACKKGAEADGWAAHDAAVLNAADELIGEHRVSDETYAQLSKGLTDEQLIELLFLVGNYTMLAGFLNSLDVTFDGGTDGDRAARTAVSSPGRTIRDLGSGRTPGPR
jgi:alkylhydroperoxidase family enzyme